MITLDCETEAIVGNPLADPPVAHGMAYIVPGYPPGYLHWRTEKATCKWSQAGDFLDQILRSKEPILFHNAPFDIAVLKASFPIAPWDLLTWDRIHDTMFLLYLADPYAPTLSLKPSAERYLGLPPDEKDELTSWILSHVPEATRKTAGAYIVRAPVDLIAPYAIGDVTRTLGIFEHLYDSQPRGAYDRERQLMPTLSAASKRGIRVARPALEAAIGRSEAALDAADCRVRAMLAAPGLDVSSGAALVDACEAIGLVKPDDWIRTPTGEKSTAKGNLELVIPDKALLNLLKYRASLSTCLGTFMHNWLAMSERTGRLHPEWNQVRTNEDGKRYGTRTGRISCSKPNLTNVPTEFEQEIPEGLPPLPFMRQFLLPEEGHVWLKRDFSGQELRWAAHFEDGPLLAAYKSNPDLDPHQMAKELILQMLHKDFSRKHTKITGFQIIYGGGANAISNNIGCSYDDGREFKDAYFTAMPGIKALSEDINRRGRSGLPITTWGGRTYFKEPSKMINGRMVDFSYKLLNYLIQGSAADQTKDAIIRWCSENPNANFLVQVYDEVGVSAPKEEWEPEMERLKRIMEADLLDCPMKTEGFVGENWHDIVPCR